LRYILGKSKLVAVTDAAIRDGSRQSGILRSLSRMLHLSSLGSHPSGGVIENHTSAVCVSTTSR